MSPTDHAAVERTAWDRLFDLLDRLTADPRLPIDSDVEQTFAELCAEAVRDRDIDSELHVPDIARWLIALVTAHRTVRASHPEVDADTELANLRRIATRWLHPPRPR